MSPDRTASFFAHSASWQDPRLEKSKLHKPMDIMFIAVYVVEWANEVVGVEKFGNAQKAWLKQYLELPKTFRRTTGLDVSFSAPAG